MESSPPNLAARTRATTLQDGPKSAATTHKNARSTSDEVSTLQHGDIFEKESAGAPDGPITVGGVAEDVQELPSGFHDLPIELLSLTDRY